MYANETEERERESFCMSMGVGENFREMIYALCTKRACVYKVYACVCICRRERELAHGLKRAHVGLLVIENIFQNKHNPFVTKELLLLSNSIKEFYLV